MTTQIKFLTLIPFMYTQNKNPVEEDTENIDICGCQGEGGGGRKNWEFGVSRCKLLSIEWDKQQGPTV